MTPTPETDAHYATTKTAWPQQGDIDLARKLERERDQLRKVADALFVANTTPELEQAFDSYNQLPHVKSK